MQRPPTKQEEDNRTIELGPPDKRARGRPPKQESLTPAERARRYRERQKAQRVGSGEINRGVTENKAADVVGQLVRLQMRLDQEHHLTVELQTELATVRQQQKSAKKPAANPLASEVAKLRKTVAEQEKVISAYSAKINKLHYELKSSRGRVNAVVDAVSEDKRQMVLAEQLMHDDRDILRKLAKGEDGSKGTRPYKRYAGVAPVLALGGWRQVSDGTAVRRTGGVLDPGLPTQAVPTVTRQSLGAGGDHIISPDDEPPRAVWNGPRWCTGGESHRCTYARNCFAHPQHRGSGA